MRVGLALSGGGALGAAHVGVIEELVRHDVPLDLVCGTSAGAIVGLLYCEGGLDAVYGFLNDFAALRMTSKVRGLVTRPPARIFTELRALLSQRVKSRDLLEVRPRFVCVATDLAEGGPVALTEGDPVACVMASAAYPGVFPAQQVAGRWLIDGGVTSNLSADVVRSAGMDFVIGSSLYAVARTPRAEWRSPVSRLQTMVRAIEMMECALSGLQMKYCDFCFMPSAGTHKWYDFDRLPAILAQGREHGASRIEALSDMLASRRADELRQP